MLYTIRTTSGREDIVLDMIETKLKTESIEIQSIVHPAEIKGYVFAEGSLANIHKMVQGLMHVRGIIEKPIRLDEIVRFLEYKKTRITIDLNDIVEIVGGSFKSERGKVTRVDKVKGEVTIELLEASIPIPVTIATEFVKVIKRAKQEKPPEPEPKRETTLGTQLEEESEKETIKENPPEQVATISQETEEEAEKIIVHEAEEEETSGTADEKIDKELTKESEDLTKIEAQKPPEKKEESIEDVKKMMQSDDVEPIKIEPDESIEEPSEEKSLLEELDEDRQKKEKKKGFDLDEE